MADRLIVNARAPVRLDFAGGWTDVAPFAVSERGVVVNAALDLHARVTLETGTDRYRLESKDLGARIEAATLDELSTDGPLGLLGAAVRMYRLGPCAVTTWCEAPAGSGLGSSGAMDVALVSAFEAAAGRPLDRLAVAERAWELETIEAALPGGKQDQYAAALGGWQWLEFEAGRVSVKPLAPPAGFVEALADRIVVCYTGQSRVSAGTISRVMGRYQAGDEVVATALREMVDVAERMAAAVNAADLPAVASLVARNWELQQRLDAGMRTGAMAELERRMARVGALGGKAAGAGAGGTMFFVVDGDRAAAVREACEAGATVLPIAWAREGVSVW